MYSCLWILRYDSCHLLLMVFWLYLIMCFARYTQHLHDKLSCDTWTHTAFHFNFITHRMLLLISEYSDECTEHMLNGWVSQLQHLLCSLFIRQEQLHFKAAQPRIPCGQRYNLQAHTNTHWVLTGGLTHTHACTHAHMQIHMFGMLTTNTSHS